MTRKENPFPSDGDAAKIPKFTDFFICLREDRIEQMSRILLPLLERANIGEVQGNHDVLVVGEIGRGKTHLLKFLEKKVSGKRVKLVSDSLEIPNFINILPIYVKFDASMTVNPDMFVYFFLNYLFGYGVENFGLVNSPGLKGVYPQLKKTVEELYEKRIGHDIRKPRTIAAQHAISLIYEVCEESVKLVGKKSVLFLLDELEGIILTAEKQKKESLILVMDFLRQFHDSINQEGVSPVNLYTLYAMTAPAYDRAQQAREESGAWLSRLRSHVIEIPQFSEEELIHLVSCALERDTPSDTDPFDRDVLTYIYRSVMGMPRFAIEALHNSYNYYLKENLSKVGPREVFLSTSWLNPEEVVDKGKVAKLKGELGQRYAYMGQIFSELIDKSTVSLDVLVERSRKLVHLPEIKRERVVADLNKFQDLGYVEISSDGESIKVLQSFYNRILREPERVEGPVKVIDPAQFIAGSSETALVQVKMGKISEEERVSRLQEALDRVLKQLFAEEGISFLNMSGGWRLYDTKRSPRGASIKLLAKSMVNSTPTQVEIIEHLDETRANAILFLHDFDDATEEQRTLRRLKDMVLPEPYSWVKDFFGDCFKEIPDTWHSDRLIEEVTRRITLSEMCILQPVSYGRKSFTPRGRTLDQVLIDVRGLWYSITEMGRTLDPTHAQLLDTTLKYVIQDFFGPLRKEVIDKSSVQTKQIDFLLGYDKKLLNFTKTLMRDEKCREAILKQQVILFTDLPPGVNPRNMNKLCDTGLFSKTSETSWKANSLNDAQRLNPWITYIVFNSTMGKSSAEITKDIRDAKLGPFKGHVLLCLKFYFNLLKSLELVKDEQVVLVDNRALMLQNLQKTRKKFSSLKQREFAGSEYILEGYIGKLDQIEADNNKIEKTARTRLEKDNMYKMNLERLDSLCNEIQKIIDEKRNEAIGKQTEIAEKLEQAEKEQKTAIAICDSLDFNKPDSPIVRALMKKPKVKRYVLEIQLSLARPRMLDSIWERKRSLEEKLNEGLFMEFLSDCESFEINLNEAVAESREIEDEVKRAVDDYLNEIRENYERLLYIPQDFSPGSKAEISEMVGTSFRHLSNEKYVESILSAGEAKLLLSDYIDSVLKRVQAVTKDKKGELISCMKRQKSYLKNSMLILHKKAPTSDKSIHQKLEKRSKDIYKEVDIFDELAAPDLSEGSVTGITDGILNFIQKITYRKQSIKQSVDSLNEDILNANRSAFKGAFAKALKFISEFGGLDSLNYSEFIRTVGNKIEAEEAIIDLIELGLVSLNMGVSK